MKNKFSDYIIITSDEPWSDIWMPQLHYAYQLSKRYKILFIDPPIPWKIVNLFKWKHHSKEVINGIVVLRYLNVIPFLFGKLALKINDFINQKLLEKRFNQLSIQPNIIMWRFDPFRSMYIFDKLNEARQVYHVIDPIAGHDLDVPLSLRAELVIITSPKFIDHYRNLNTNVLQVGQGVDLEFYNTKLNYSEVEVEHSRNSILLLGTYTDEIDYLFLNRLAKKFPHNLVMIGPDKTTEAEIVKNFNNLKSEPNVFWLGPMSPDVFRKHLEVCKVGIISYNQSHNEKNSLRSPLKVIGYLAAGKSIISNIDCETPTLLNKGIYIAENDESYFHFLELCYNDNLLFDKIAVDEFLKKIDYNNFLEQIFDKLNEPLRVRN